ncbi:hypothetical protein Dsin_013195 [Dipteronia sinensis]|uniref:Gnk2-homologous domain-containing protein n=1 Tax=Dipteronia sinensis TaxID=43782 RepID=A0AAE0AKD3_9ROSI|nr:hypothetical protein Dsin_013195 [Dipteronia sinensis]
MEDVAPRIFWANTIVPPWEATFLTLNRDYIVLPGAHQICLQQNCRACLKTAFYRITQDDDLLGKQGGRVFIPSCFVRYELYKFYGDPILVGAPVPISPPQGRRTKKETGAWIRITIITASAVFVMVLFSTFVWCMWRRHNQRDKEEKRNSQEP